MDQLALRNKLTNGKDLSIAECEYLKKVLDALDESLKIQSHYARMLNRYDGGARKEFPNADAWLARLAELDSATH